jgi:hypothetical protein
VSCLSSQGSLQFVALWFLAPPLNVCSICTQRALLAVLYSLVALVVAVCSHGVVRGAVLLALTCAACAPGALYSVFQSQERSPAPNCERTVGTAG